MFAPINLNNNIRVKLLPRGVERLRQFYQDASRQSGVKVEAPATELAGTMQLWHFLNVFGACGAALHDLCEMDAEVELDEAAAPH